MEKKEEIESRIFLKPKQRKPFQTTGYIYKALDIAEKQIEKLLLEIKTLKNN